MGAVIKAARAKLEGKAMDGKVLATASASASAKKPRANLELISPQRNTAHHNTSPHDAAVPLPETIAVKYTEEEAEYLSMRPWSARPFALPELVDMIVQVAEKVACACNKFSAPAPSSSIPSVTGGRPSNPILAGVRPKFSPAILTPTPRAPSAPPIAPKTMESSGSPPRHSLRITQQSAAKSAGPLSSISRARRCAPSFWSALMNFADQKAHPRYREYSYTRRADIYSIALTADQLAHLGHELASHAPRRLRAELRDLPTISQIVFVCPRPAK